MMCEGDFWYMALVLVATLRKGITEKDKFLNGLPFWWTCMDVAIKDNIETQKLLLTRKHSDIDQKVF